MRFTTSALAVAFLCGVCAAQGGPGSQPGQPGGQMKEPQFDAERFLKDHDKNGDGKLTKDELPARLQSEFAATDKNGDGSVTMDELKKHAAEMTTRRPQMVEMMYYVIDVPEPAQPNAMELQQAYDTLRKIDSNNDGKVTPEEIAAYREQRRKDRMKDTFEYLDQNKDNKVSKDEARGLWKDDFDKLDTNKDGFLDEKEIQAAYDMKPGKQ